MSERSLELYLTDILEAGQAIQSYVADVDLGDFKLDRMRQSAVIREFAIIGEAVGKLPDSLKFRAPQIAWQDIKDFRNLLIHEYFGVDLDIIWQVIKDELPPLLEKVAERQHSTD